VEKFRRIAIFIATFLLRNILSPICWNYFSSKAKIFLHFGFYRLQSRHFQFYSSEKV